MPRKTTPKKDIGILPVEEGVSPDGTPFVKAMIVADTNSPLYRSSPMAKAAGIPRSRIPRDAPKSFYRTGALVEPLLKPQMLQAFMINNPTHAICVNKKARLVAGMGIKLITKFDERDARTKVRKYEDAQKAKAEEKKAKAEQDKLAADQEAAAQATDPSLVGMGKAAPKIDPEEKKLKADYLEARQKLDQSAAELERLQEFIDEASDETTFREILERGWMDFESLGNMNWEVLRDEQGDPVRMTHIPAIMLRVTKDRERYAYVAPPYTQPIFFKRYGDPRHLNKLTGEFRPWKGEPGADNFDGGLDFGANEASEVLRYIAYNAQDTFYGIPTWYAALGDMIGGAESRDFMIQFFTDKAVPLYAVLLEGGSWTPENIAKIEKFFRRELVGHYHATLALEIPSGGKITFQQVSPEPRWWPFILKYRDTVRDVIVSVHGLSPAIVGVIETAHLGGGTGDSQMETVKTTEIRPRQETLEWLLNLYLVRRGLGLGLVMLKLDEIDTRDEAKVSQSIASLYANPIRPSLTLNDTRKMLRLPPVEAAWADKILIQDPQFGLLPLEDMEEAVRAKQKAMQVAGAQQGMELQPGQQGPATPGAPGTPMGQAMGVPPPADAGGDFEALLAQIANAGGAPAPARKQVDDLRAAIKKALSQESLV